MNYLTLYSLQENSSPIWAKATMKMTSRRRIDRLYMEEQRTFLIYNCKMTTRRTLTLPEKIQLIRDNEENVSYRTLADKYKISIGSASNIIKLCGTRRALYARKSSLNAKPPY